MPTTARPADNTTSWIGCTADEIKPGMKVRVVEKYPSGATLTAEGVAERVFYGDDGLRRLELVGVPPTVRSTPPDGWDVELYREPKKLPLAAGSAIKIFHPSLPRDRVAVRRLGRRPRGNWGEEWYWADSNIDEIIDDHLLENAEILFDAGDAR